MSSVTRRTVLRAAGGAITLSVASQTLVFAAAESARLDAAGFGDEQLLTLLRLAYLIAPHPDLATEVYHDAMLQLADGVAASEEQRQLVIDGIARLDADQSWLNRPQDEQLARVRTLDSSPFFGVVREATLRGLYRDERTWTMLGYEGVASRFGGYLNRGLNDIDWLPGDDSVSKS